MILGPPTTHPTPTIPSATMTKTAAKMSLMRLLVGLVFILDLTQFASARRNKKGHKKGVMSAKSVTGKNNMKSRTKSSKGYDTNYYGQCYAERAPVFCKAITEVCGPNTPCPGDECCSEFGYCGSAGDPLYCGGECCQSGACDNTPLPVDGPGTKTYQRSSSSEQVYELALECKPELGDSVVYYSAGVEVSGGSEYSSHGCNDEVYCDATVDGKDSVVCKFLLDKTGGHCKNEKALLSINGMCC